MPWKRSRTSMRRVYCGNHQGKRKMKNLLMLSLRSPYLDDSKIYTPMASLYLKAYLNKNAPNTEVVLGDDEYSTTDFRWCENYDAIGLSIMTPQRAEAYRLAHAIKLIFPNKTLIAGGPHVKHYKAEVESSKVFDYVVPYDGERPLT